MKVVKAHNISRRMELGDKIRVASSLLDRAIGLLGTPSLSAGQGLWISPCKSIHTFFMRYPIDVLFLDADGKVLDQGTFQPWRVSAWQTKSHGVLELGAGVLVRTGTQVGDHIEMKDLN
jgi:uncharacterized membrane protein (UPF0127 family)